MKKILVAAIFMSLLPISAVAVENPPSVAILDTAINTSLPIFKDRIVYEACVLEWDSCPNGKNFMEGPGSAVMESPYINNNGFAHGTQMASAEVLSNPNIKIVFVRIIGSTMGGVRKPIGEAGIINAMNWVLENKNRFNIQAVALSQGNPYYIPGTNYCPSFPKITEAIKALTLADMPLFVPAGNESNYTRINWPACIPETVSIGSTDALNKVSTYSNYDSKLLDFVTIGTMKLTGPDGLITNQSGTSIAAQVAAAQYIAIKTAKPNLNSIQILELINKTSVVAKSTKHGPSKLINLKGAING